MDEETTLSGIRVANDGTRYVGGTVRADGTVRKTYKVRAGYAPPEDVPKYVARRRAEARSASPAVAGINKILAGKAGNTEDIEKLAGGLSTLSINERTSIPRTKERDSSNDQTSSKREIVNRALIDEGKLTTEERSKGIVEPITERGPENEVSKKRVDKPVERSEDMKKQLFSSDCQVGDSSQGKEPRETVNEKVKEPLQLQANDESPSKYVPPWKRK
jgi:hypothetical protein